MKKNGFDIAPEEGTPVPPFVDLAKEYKTAEGFEVKFAVIDGDVVHGFFKRDNKIWNLCPWQIADGSWKHALDANKDELRLVECPPFKAVSVELIVTEDHCVFKEGDLPGYEVEFARILINAKVEQGQKLILKN